MADLTLAERSPLARVAVQCRLGRLDGDAGVVLSEVAGRSMTLLIARRGQVAEAVALAASAGVALPHGPKLVAADGFSVLWAGPEQWLVMAEARGRVQAERVTAACARACMTIDQSDARAGVSVGGVRARDALAKGVPIDLHPRAFGPGDVALTVVAGISVQIWQVDATPRFELAMARSLAESFWHWLTEASAEFGYSVVA